MRLLLALSLAALSTFLGYAKAYSLSSREAALSAFVEEVPQLLLRMAYESLPLHRLARALAERGSSLAPFWAAFGEGLREQSAEAAWWQALCQSPPYGLRLEDQALLRGLGGALAAPDGAGRRQAADHILGEAARQRDILREEAARKGNLYGTLGLLLGLAVAILII